MNLGLIEEITAGLRTDGVRPVLDPQPGYCCVAIGGVNHDQDAAHHRAQAIRRIPRWLIH